MADIHHFYHMYTNGNWQWPTREHIEALQKYGLADNLTTFQVGLVGSPESREEGKEFLNSTGIQYTICTEVDDGWEQETQDKILEFAQENDGYVLYAHTKNAVNINNLHVHWRRSMTYYTVVTWKECIELLDQNVSGVGSHYLPESNNEVHSRSGFFAGTFWWSHLKYIKKFPAPDRSSRFGAEGWIGWLKETVEGGEEPFTIKDFNPTHPAEHSGMVIDW